MRNLFKGVAITLIILMMVTGCSKREEKKEVSSVATVEATINVAPNWEYIHQQLEEEGDFETLASLFESLDEGTYTNPDNEDEYAELSKNPLRIMIRTENHQVFIDLIDGTEEVDKPALEWGYGDELVSIPWDKETFVERTKEIHTCVYIPTSKGVLWIDYYNLLA